MGIYIAYGSLIPLIVILTYLIFKEINNIQHHRSLKRNVENKNINITHKDFTKLDLKIVEADYRLPKGQWAHFTYDLPLIKEGVKNRKYTGNTISGIRLPFMSLSIQNKEFRDENEFINKGPAKITLTNKLLRVQSHMSDNSLRRNWKLSSIEQVKFVTDDKTIQVSTNVNAWPLRLTFVSHEQAIEFINAIWTLIDKYTSIKLQESGKGPEDKYESKLKALTKNELMNIALEKYDKDSLKGYLKKDLINLLLKDSDK